MKRLFSILALSLCLMSASAQEKESVHPVMGQVEIARICDVVDIEGSIVKDAVIYLKTGKTAFSYSISNKVDVKVKQGKKTIFHKKLKNAYLYIFSNGQVQVGQPRINNIIIGRDSDGSIVGQIRIMEGIW